MYSTKNYNEFVVRVIKYAVEQGVDEVFARNIGKEKDRAAKAWFNMGLEPEEWSKTHIVDQVVDSIAKTIT